MHSTKAVWPIVSWSRFPFHDGASPPGSGVTVNVTVPMFIGSLNVATTDCPTGTLNAPSVGFVDTMYGLMQTVRNVHGFGTGPATRFRSSFTSLPVRICAV